MRIMHNLMAINANQNRKKNTNALSKNLEKLSSGYKINRAADDAAGLAISEKMRAQISGYHQGLNNIKDGQSFCQVAEGALQEVHDMLGRVKYLSVQSANGTYTDAERKSLDAEVQSLYEEINRIGEHTYFSSVKVFREVGTDYQTTIGTPTTENDFFKLLQNSDITVSGYMDEPLKAVDVKDMNSTSEPSSDLDYTSAHIDFQNIVPAKIDELVDKDFYLNCCTNCCPTHIVFTDEVGISQSGDTVSIGIKKADASPYTADEFCEMIVEGFKTNNIAHVEFACNGSKLYMYDIDNINWSSSNKKMAYFCDVPDDKTVTATLYGDLNIQMSGKSNDYMTIIIGDLSVNKLGLEGSGVDPLEKALQLIDLLDDAVDKLSHQRSHIGSFMNRLDHGYMVNSNIKENLTAAESRIRDTDMAEEMTSYTKNNILNQASQAMLSQANTVPQGILQLLQ